MTPSQSDTAAQAAAQLQPFALNIQAFTWPLQAWTSALQAMGTHALHAPAGGVGGMSWSPMGQPNHPWLGLAWQGVSWPRMQVPGTAWPAFAWPDVAAPGLAWPGLMWPGSIDSGAMQPGSTGFGMTPQALASLFLTGLTQFHSLWQEAGTPQVTRISFAWPGDAWSGYLKWMSALPQLAWPHALPGVAAGHDTPSAAQFPAWPGFQWLGSTPQAWLAGPWQQLARFWESRLRELALMYSIPPALAAGPV